MGDDLKTKLDPTPTMMAKPLHQWSLNEATPSKGGLIIDTLIKRLQDAKKRHSKNYDRLKVGGELHVVGIRMETEADAEKRVEATKVEIEEQERQAEAERKKLEADKKRKQRETAKKRASEKKAAAEKAKAEAPVPKPKGPQVRLIRCAPVIKNSCAMVVGDVYGLSIREAYKAVEHAPIVLHPYYLPYRTTEQWKDPSFEEMLTLITRFLNLGAAAELTE